LFSLREHVYCAQVWHLPLHKRALSRTWSCARLVPVYLVMTSQVYVWPWRLSWTSFNLCTLHTFNKSCYLLGCSFVHFLIYEWNDSYDIMLFSTGVSWIYRKFEMSTRQTIFNRKKLHVPPRTVGITADYVQYVKCTGLCRVCWLLVFAPWVVWVTEWASSFWLCCRLQDTGFGPQ